MSDSTMQIHLPEELITNTIRAEMVKQLGGLEAVAKQIVIAAMEEQAEGQYGRKKTRTVTVNGRRKEVPVTKFEEQIATLIRAEGAKIFAEWLEGYRDTLRDELLDHLQKDKSALLKQMVESLLGQISRYNVTVNLNLNREEY